MSRKFPIVLSVVLVIGAFFAHAAVDDSQSYVMEAAAPYVEEGFSMRYEFWDGTMRPGERKVIQHQLFKGMEYWFWVAAEWPGCTMRVHAYDEAGELVEAESWTRDQMAGVRLSPEKTGSHYLLVEVVSAPGNDPVNWSMGYAYR